MNRISNFFCILFCLCSVASASVIRIPADYPFIQEGIDAALDFDTVLVADGIYLGHGNSDLRINNKSISLKSENGSENCIIDAESTSPCITFEGYGSSTIDGFTIRNGAGGTGGGIICETLNDTTIISHCSITENTFSEGGGIYCTGLVQIIDCDISSNIPHGIATRYPCRNPRIERCSITGSSGSGFDAMGYSAGGGECYPEIYDCLIMDNGGGISCYYRANPTITHSVIHGNDGPGVSCTAYSTAIIENCRITDNTGGGVTCFTGSPVLTRILESTISGNSSDEPGGGLQLRRSMALVNNCIFWNNTASHGDEIALVEGPSEITISHCDVAGGESGISFEPDCAVVWESSNFDLDPLFVQGQSGTLYLSQIASGQTVDSPCVDAGSASSDSICFQSASGTICLDELTTRTDETFDSGMADIGYHYPSLPSPTPVCSEQGVEIRMPSHMFHSGDHCSCNVTVCNTTGNDLTDNPLFVILDVYGEYFCAPTFSSYNYYTATFHPGETTIDVIQEFVWPENAGSANGIIWYAALTDPEITEIAGAMGTWSFSWGE